MFDFDHDRIDQMSFAYTEDMWEMAGTIMAQPDLGDALRHQTAYYSLKNGRPYSFANDLQVVRDWRDGKYRSLTTHFVARALCSFWRIQHNIWLYREYNSRCESQTSNNGGLANKAKTKKAQARKAAALRREANVVRVATKSNAKSAKMSKADRKAKVAQKVAR